MGDDEILTVGNLGIGLLWKKIIRNYHPTTWHILCAPKVSHKTLGLPLYFEFPGLYFYENKSLLFISHTVYESSVPSLHLPSQLLVPHHLMSVYLLVALFLFRTLVNASCGFSFFFFLLMNTWAVFYAWSLCATLLGYGGKSLFKNLCFCFLVKLSFITRDQTPGKRSLYQ